MSKQFSLYKGHFNCWVEKIQLVQADILKVKFSKCFKIQ